MLAHNVASTPTPSKIANNIAFPVSFRKCHRSLLEARPSLVYKDPFRRPISNV